MKREPVPRLVLRFAVVTALGLAVAAAAIVAVVRQAYTVQGEQRAITRARVTTELALQGQLRVSDLRAPVSAARRRSLESLFSQRVLGNGTLAAALYNSRGVATFATGGTAPGPLPGTPVREALAGKVIAHVDHTRSGSGRVLNTYVPVAIGPGGARAVIALEQDYGPIAAATRRSALLIAGALEALLVALCLFLIPMLARASGRIRRQVAALDRLATHDELTSLPNRIGFRRALDELAVGPAARTGVMLVDLERFHEINDTLGPERADRLLAEVAARLDGLEHAVLVARLGEDEFGILFPDPDEERVTQMAERIGRVLASPITIDGQRVAVEARVGCAFRPRDGTEATVLLRRAGVALSVAKESGSSVEIYDPDHDASDVSRLSLTAELREALRENQLTVHYQPQADLATGAIRGVEALVRWQHPQRGLLTAAEFIPAAEQTGLIGEIGRFVLETSARQWQEWKAVGIAIDMAVNLAAIDLLDPHLPSEVDALIEQHGLPAEYLVLEITERTLLRDERHTRDALRQLHRIGARLAVDDYGTGYSSLAYLRTLQPQQVKLDRTFIAGIPGDTVNTAIIRSTIELAHKLGATVVAEGVETQEQWQHLAGLGCDIAQGYLIGRPVAASELLPLLTGRPTLRIVAA